MGVFIKPGAENTKLQNYMSNASQTKYEKIYQIYNQDIIVPEGFTIYCRGMLSTMETDTTKFTSNGDGYTANKYVSSLKVVLPITMYDDSNKLVYYADPLSTNERFTIYLKSGMIVNGAEINKTGWKSYNKSITINQ